MFELYLKLRTETPLLITQRKFGEGFQCLDYIPGSSLRGAVAELFNSYGIEPNSTEFKDIFIDGKVRFGNLYYKDGNTNDIQYPQPLSWYYCKADKNHLSLDCLKIEIPDKCKICDSRMVNKPIPSGVKKTLSMHNAIDFFTQTTEEKKLFYYELICEGQSFCGKIKSTKEEYLSVILEMIKDRFCLGKGITRGLGKVSVVNSRITESQVKLDKIDEIVTITLLSDAILMNEDGTFLRTLTSRYLGLGNIMPEKAFTRTREITLWNSAAGLPRETVIALVAGSCFSFKLPNTKDLLGRLEQIESEGISIRKEQGFGEVKINDERHK